MAKISIIIPIYNTEKYLHRCIDSILVQTFSDFELILVDDGSTDNSGKICDEYESKDKRIKVFHQENQGQAKARNVALDYVFERGKTDWIAFIDSDDWVHPCYLELLLDAAFTHNVKISNVFMTQVHSGEEVVNKDRGSYYSSIERMEDVYISFGKEVACYSQGRLYDVSLWEKIRFPEGMIWEDVATIFKVLLQVDEVALVHGDLYYYYIHAESTTGSKWSPRFFDEFKAYEHQLADKRIINNQIISPRLREQFISNVYRQLMCDINNAVLTKKERNKYLKILKKEFRHVLRKYSRGTRYDFNIRKDLFETAFPIEMNIYWYGVALKNKLKKS